MPLGETLCESVRIKCERKTKNVAFYGERTHNGFVLFFLLMFVKLIELYVI